MGDAIQKVKQEKTIWNHIAEITGLELENDYENTVGPALQLEEEPIKDMAQRAEDYRICFDHGMNVHRAHDHFKGVDDIIEIDCDSDSDYDEYGDYIPGTSRIEYYDSRDYRSEVDPDKNQDGVFIEDVNEVQEKKSSRLGRGHRTRTQTTTDYVTSWNNKSYPKGDTKAVNMTQIEIIGSSYPD